MVDSKALHEFSLSLLFQNKIWTRHIIATHDTNKKKALHSVSVCTAMAMLGFFGCFFQGKKRK